MVEITQQENFAIGSKEAVLSLEKKELAKALVISDSHSNSRVLQAIVSEFGSDCDVLCFCGDGLLDLIETIELGFYDSEFGKHIPPVICLVRGNGDNSTTTIFTDKRTCITVPEFLEISIAGKKLFLTHGHRYNVYYGTKDLRSELIRRGMDLVFYGHTHVANSMRSHVTRDGRNDFLGILNPGSCAQARGGMPNTFAIVSVHRDENKNICQFYKIIQNRFGDYKFDSMPTPRGEIKLF